MSNNPNSEKQRARSQFNIIAHAFDVKRIIIIDDDFDAQDHDYGVGAVAAIRAFETIRGNAEAEQQLRDIGLDKHGFKAFDINNQLQSPTYIENSVTSSWDSLPIDTRKKFFEIADMPDTTQVTRNAVSKLSDMLPDDIEVTPYSVVKWVEDRAKIFQDFSDESHGRTLALVDLSLKNADLSTWENPPYETAGYALVKEILEDGGDGFIPGILTNEAKDDEKELELADRQFENGVIAGVMRKGRIDPERPAEFAKGIEMLLAANVLFEIRQATVESFDSTPKASELIDPHINLGALLHMAAAAENEGVHLSTSLGQMIAVHHNEHAALTIRTACANLPKANALRAFQKESFCKMIVPETGQIDAFSILHRDAYIDKETLAGYRLPTAIGDVYAMASHHNDEREYWTLLQQSCNIMVRHKGTRKRPVSAFTLVKIIQEPKQTNTNRYSITVPCPDPGDDAIDSNYVADFQATLFIPPFALDLCVFDTKGKSRIDSQAADDGVPQILLEPGWTIYEKQLRKELETKRAHFEQLRALIKNAEDTTEADKVISALLAGVFGLPINSCMISYDASNQLIDFGIERIARLRNPYAENLLTEYARYLSRAAYPGKTLYEKDSAERR